MLSVTLEPVDFSALEANWRDLERRSDSSFFLSWCWIGSWLKCLPAHIVPKALYIRSGSRIVGLATVTDRPGRVLGVAKYDRWLLNQTGDDTLDVIAMEYNGILADREMPNAVIHAGLQWLMRLSGSNHVIRLGGIELETYTTAYAAGLTAGRRERIHSRTPAPYVDLSEVRARGGDYLSLLSRNCRQNIRRAKRAYQNRGPLSFTVAQTLDQALEFLAELKVLHQAYWNARGQPGAFASPFFERFHTQLLETAFAAGHIEMAKVSAGDEPIGYLHNFLWRDTVYAYQSGFRYETQNRYKPGYVSHSMAIEKALAEDWNIYDFMAGEAQHKRSLSTGTRDLIWVEFSNRGFATDVEFVLRDIKSWLSPDDRRK